MKSWFSINMISPVHPWWCRYCTTLYTSNPLLPFRMSVE